MCLRPLAPTTLTGLFFLALGLFLPYEAFGQRGSPAESVHPLAVPRFPVRDQGNTTLSGPARPGEYLGAAGARAAWLGLETGEGEVWVHPLKVAREIRLAFKVPEYSDPIPAANVARRVDIRPEAHTVVYSHAAFQVKQHILVPRDAPGVLLLLEVDAVVDLEIHVEFQPVLQYAWPGGLGGQYLFWDAENRVFVLSESLQERNAVFGSPWATEASAHPAHRLAEAPSTFVIPVDRERAKTEFIPIAIVGGTAPRSEILEDYRRLLEGAGEAYRANLSWAEEVQTGRLRVSGSSLLSIEGPGEPRTPARIFSFSQSLEWAKVNLEEQRVCNPDLGCGLVAGWGPSGTSLRPGFGWFFGGDAAINTLAMDATGQWNLVVEGLRFLARYQREDGKIPHEISQAAGTLPWFDSFPYAYYHADTTPFWMLALWRYWRASGDDAVLRELWPAFLNAFRWCLSVETDGDGIIENTTGGLGAIEVGGLGEGIHQDIYLAAVWMEALKGTSEMARALGDGELAEQAQALLRQASRTLNQRYWRPDEGHLAFGILRDGSTNDNLTAWPGTALSFGLVEEERAEATLRHLASDAISSRWGARLLSTDSELFDPLHYNNGAVWPFMTGFVSWAQYRYRRPWAGFPLLQALHALTFDWALGRHPENLSGAYYQTMDATVPHQFFASSMLVTPLVRGLLGWDPDAPGGRAILAPQPPPSWRTFEVHDLKVGGSRVAFSYRRGAGTGEALARFSVEGPPGER
ncbi:MAG: amylo-alpha-1,6-glucosidase, partial [Longimicrobiales bacterium]